MHSVPPLDSANLGLHVHIIIIKIEVMHMDHVVYGLLLGRIVAVRLAGGEPR